MNKTQILIALVILSLFGMSSVYIDLSELVGSNNEEAVVPEKKVKHGEVRQYTKDQRLKTVVNYNQGIKHGTSYLYHDDGETVLLAMPYVNGKREGVSEKFYENGNLYASTSYMNDKLHGPRKLFYSNSQSKAVINYGYGHVGIGTVEYLINGEEKEAITITTQKEGSKIWLDTSSPCKDTQFYIGSLIEDTFLNPVDKNIKSLMREGDRYYVDTEVHTPSYLKYQDIICSCESSQGNPIILKSRLF
ncbi:toxin-antitoxin system YwqK family antitoxin [Ekhidna sp.]|uniref:toxin-antitoxin system YwqK family antitoxin n=1 Tax=Ekhidna sp. TaxID=2608089 RepID=UPI00351625E6